MSERYGPRFAPGGYQAPSTHAVTLNRGRPLRSEHWRIGSESIDLALVPLEGGRPELFELEYKRNDWLRARSVYVPCLIRGAEHARQAFALTAAALDAGEIPEQVLTPPGTPLGP